MKTIVNREVINRICVNSTKISGACMSDAGKAKTSLLHPSLVDYWSFKGKSNSDPDRDTIKGVKGGILTARNLNWGLMSGYGGYGTNYTDWNLMEGYAACDVTKTTILIKEVFMNMPFIKYSGNPQSIEYQIKVSGITNQTLIYVHGDLEEIRITKDGIYNIPTDTTAYMNFAVAGNGKCNISIEALPIYPGAIVTDGVDDNLIFDKTGYDIGTVICKHRPIKVVNWSFVYDIQDERRFIGYENTTDRISHNFDRMDRIGDYVIFRNSTPSAANSFATIGCMNRGSLSNFIGMALYDIALYEDSLTDTEIEKEIIKMQSL